MLTALAWLAGRIPTWVPVVLILALTAGATLLLHQRNSARLSVAGLTADLATQRSEYATSLAKAIATARDTETWLRLRVDAAAKLLNDERSKNAKLLADFRSVRDERDGLHQQLAAYSAGPAASADTLPACRDRSNTLGDVLGQALRAAEECAGATETEAGNVRALLKAWPLSNTVAE